MDNLASIKPTEKRRIMDVVEEVGIDVTDWKASGPANPKYCYQWGFANDDRSHILLCLWYDDCKIDDEGIYQEWNFREYIKEMEAHGGPKAGRARRVDELLQDAWRLKAPLRIAIVDETDKKKSSKNYGDTSETDFRVLDPIPWRLVHYDWMTGACVLRRNGDGGEEQSDHRNEQIAEDLLAAAARTDIPNTTRKSLIEARVGQGRFRADLIKAWGGKCAVTGCPVLAMLRASHVKPWRSCEDSERLHAANGLLLTANLDALFDAGLISFLDDGEMLISDELSSESVADLGLPLPLQKSLSDEQKRYLAFHREERFPHRKGR